MIELTSIEPQPFFPTYVWVMDLPPEDYEPLNQKLARDLNMLTKPRPQITRGQNWQTEQNMHEFEEFDELIALFLSAAEKVLAAFELEHGPLRITGCWANINPKGAFHIPHTHPNNFLSGIYYVQALPGADSVSFHEPRPQLEVIAPLVRHENKYNSTVQHLAVKPGRMVIFPSWLIHSVTANTSDQLRISVSCNFMFSSFAETMSQPKWTGISLRRT